MRRILSILLFVLPIAAIAGPGDTTWVQAQYDKQLPWFGNYDTTITFPNGSTSYRNIYMQFTLGKYACPGTPTYCGDWDYTVQTYLMTPAGDTFELGRLITPYANSGAPRTPLTWKGYYTYDVTDYYPLLKNGATIRVHYSGYSGGFTSNVRFAFIEGTRTRNVTGIQRLWDGSFVYGRASNPINTAIAQKSLTIPSGTSSAELKLNVTGHGYDSSITQCAEFCSKHYNVMLNGASVEQRDIWRNDCGSNWIYPQSGTWVYDRANWCPGDIVHVNNHVLNGVSSGSSATTLDVDFQAYTSLGSGTASYIVSGAVIYYGGYNKTVDASLTDIVSPTTKEIHFRQNTSCGKPKVRVQNTGSTTLTQMVIQYGLQGTTTPQTYTWSGTLPALQSTEIEMPTFAGMASAQGTNNAFYARVTSANGATDVDATNNEMRSTFNAVPEWPASFRLNFKTTNFTNGGNNTTWKILNDAGTVVRQRLGGVDNTLFRDTLQNLPSGCYRLVVEDELCDGMVTTFYGAQVGTGYVQVVNANNAQISIPAYFNANFGCGFTQYFSVNNTTSVTDVFAGKASISVAPNPANTSVLVMLSGLRDPKGTLVAIDALGRTISRQPVTGTEFLVDVSKWPAGMYTITYYDAAGQGKLNAGVIVAR